MIKKNVQNKKRVVFLGSFKPALVFLSYKNLTLTNMIIILDESLITLYDYFKNNSNVYIFSQKSFCEVLNNHIKKNVEIWCYPFSEPAQKIAKYCIDNNIHWTIFVSFENERNALESTKISVLEYLLYKPKNKHNILWMIRYLYWKFMNYPCVLRYHDEKKTLYVCLDDSKCNEIYTDHIYFKKTFSSGISPSIFQYYERLYKKSFSILSNVKKLLIVIDEEYEKIIRWDQKAGNEQDFLKELDETIKFYREKKYKIAIKPHPNWYKVYLKDKFNFDYTLEKQLPLEIILNNLTRHQNIFYINKSAAMENSKNRK